MSEQQHRTLFQVVNYLKGLIDSQLANKRFWLKAEISSIGSKSGHYYLDLVEHRDGKVIAQCKACIWSYAVPDIKANLGDDFNNILKKGAEVLIDVDVRFNEVYGLQLVISDVDKSYALGELERRKRETFERLKSEGLLELNKQYKLPVVLQRLAVIGSPGTSGHTDLLKQLNENEFGYHYDIVNFPCSVQGEKAEREITQQLLTINNLAFDAVIMVRGGGSKLDLEVFNSYTLASTIANLNLPVLTGIGHETDISIVDLTANSYFKTPSAVGAFIVAKSREFDVRVEALYTNVRKVYEQRMQYQLHRIQQAGLEFKTSSISYTQLRRGALHTIGNRILTLVRATLASHNSDNIKAAQTLDAAANMIVSSRQNRLAEISGLIQLRSEQVLVAAGNALKHQQELVSLYSANLIKKERELLNHVEDVINIYHPNNTLERGYAIVRINGNVIQRDKKLGTGDGIEIELIDRKIKATVISESPKMSKWKTLVTKCCKRARRNTRSAQS